MTAVPIASAPRGAFTTIAASGGMATVSPTPC